MRYVAKANFGHTVCLLFVGVFYEHRHQSTYEAVINENSISTFHFVCAAHPTFSFLLTMLLCLAIFVTFFVVKFRPEVKMKTSKGEHMFDTTIRMDDQTCWFHFILRFANYPHSRLATPVNCWRQKQMSSCFTGSHLRKTHFLDNFLGWAWAVCLSLRSRHMASSFPLFSFSSCIRMGRK